jgi:hypothetical protein
MALRSTPTKPLPLRQSVGKALSYEGKLRLLKTAASRPEWQNAAWAATLALNTTMRGCEIKQPRWQDMDLMEKILAIRKSKTEAGERAFRLTPMGGIPFCRFTDEPRAAGRFALSITSSLPVRLRTSILRGHRRTGGPHGAI